MHIDQITMEGCGPPRPVSSWTSNTSKASPLSDLSGHVQTRQARAAGTRRGAKPREVYGFVGAISSVVATVIYFFWAFLPDSWLHAVGITYYPDRFWAVAIPAYLMGALVLLCLGYTALCYMATPPPDALSTLLDEHTREPQQASQPSSGIQEDEEEPIHPISDMAITDINRLLFLSNKR